MTEERERAAEPEDNTRLIVQRMNAEDAEGMATYEKDAVLAFPPGQLTVGRDAIHRVYEHLLELGVRFKQEEPLPTLRVGDLALTATLASSSGGATPI